MTAAVRSAEDGRRPGPEQQRDGLLRLLPVVVPVTLAAAGVLGAAAAMIGASPLGARGWIELSALLLAAVFVEAFPVPMRGVTAGGVSLAAVFIVASGCLYGWQFAAVLAFVTRGAIELAQRRPPIRLVYNGSVYALSGAAAGLASGGADGRQGVLRLLLQVALGATAFYAVNVLLVAAVIARASGERFSRILAQAGSSTAVPFAIMASVTVILDALWQRSPVLSAALVGPLVATSLYQRSVHRALEATELALTDPLTGLGNYRHFQEQLRRQLDLAAERETPLTLCLLDVDAFKDINDRHGHPFGDLALETVGTCLRHGGEAFRLGGDEFALLLPGRHEADGVAIATQVVGRIARSEVERGISVSVSAGVATYPSAGVERADLVRVADRALYTAKAEGKNAVRLYRPGIVDLNAKRAVEESDRRARLHAAACLARAIDVRDEYTGNHSEAVGNLAKRLAVRLGLSAEEVELVRLAGSLHDLGKLAIAEEILRKPGPPTDVERLALAAHPQVGFRMLRSLEIEPVATWVLHHHERWDGTGYPTGLSGEEIPIGSRILFVADAFEAMTTDRVYRARVSREDAIEEMIRCSGSQFDPAVVAALMAEFADDPVAELATAV